MDHVLMRKSEKIFIFVTSILSCLILFSIVPNSFGISLIATASALIWLLIAYKSPDPVMSHFKIDKKVFFIALNLWFLLVAISVSLYAWARFFSPGYDLYWFAQAVTNAKIGYGLHVSSERPFGIMLAQHWEPILYTIIPFTFFLKGSSATVLWQALGFWVGTFGAWKASEHVFKASANENLKYFLTIFYVVAFVTVNPLSFDIHPPVFGGLLFIPWILYFILAGKNRLIILLFLGLLLQCGEIYFAVVPAYLTFLILEKRINLFRICLSICLYCSGFLLIGFYQKYVGPWWTGLPFNFSARYQNIGGDGLGILKTFFHDPILVLSQVLIFEKVKTFLKIFVYFGFLPVFALFSKKYRLLVICIWLGCIPYFLQVGLTVAEMMYSTNTHYISALGSQWWCLSLFGIFFLCEESENFLFVRRLFQPKTMIPTFLILFFLNSSEWRKSPIYTFRAFLDREPVAAETRQFFSTLPKEKGVVFWNTEWLCPLAAEERYHVVCESGWNYFLASMPLDVVVSNTEDLKNLYDHELSDDVKKSKNGMVIENIINGNLDKIHWKLVIKKEQKRLRDTPREYMIWEKIEN
jgi:hypothetical protein